MSAESLLPPLPPSRRQEAGASGPRYRYLPQDLPPSLVNGAGSAQALGRPQQEPACQWRGLLLDSSRMFWTVDTILEVLEVMHRYGFNRLHWHLTDNSGWRLDVPGYPELARVASQVPRHLFAEYTNVSPQALAEYQSRAPFLNNCGFYSHEDVRTVVARAHELGIEVMPEIDIPGHAEALLRAYPSMGNPSTVGMSLREWPHAVRKRVRNDLLWPTEESFDLIDTVLETVCELFPSSIIHVGGDECDYEYWDSNPQARQWMSSHGVRDGRELQSVFTSRAREVLRRHGRRCGVWDEAVAAGLKDDEVVFGWRDGKGPRAAASSGHPWVFCDASVLYLNRIAEPDTRSDEFSPVVMNGPISVQDILSTTVPEDGRCLGVQAAVWCEFITGRTELYQQLLPRLLAVAALGYWGSQAGALRLTGLVATEAELLARAGYGAPVGPAGQGGRAS